MIHARIRDIRVRRLVVALAIGVLSLNCGAQEATGAREFAIQCAACHGKDGRGDGPIHDALSRRPSDLTLLSRNNGGAFPETVVYQIIDGRRPVDFHGTRDMPVWGRRFDLAGDSEPAIEARIDRLIQYLESIQQDVSAN